MPGGALWAELAALRRALHADPEFGFEEARTAARLAARLRQAGLEVAEGIGGTGLVATLRRGEGPAIALRADMDALRITERTNLPHASRRAGLMHACGHDGHSAMLLGAALLLAAEGGFRGTVRFLFQPAEEWGRGALAMLEDGLLARFPFEEIHGLHNMPGLAIGQLRTRPGPVMSAEDNFTIRLRGQGGHASRPQEGREVLLAACATVVALQSIVARRLDPADTAVVSATELRTDGTRNALPGEAEILGDARSFHPAVSARIEEWLRRIVVGTAAAHGCEAEIDYSREFIPTVNDAAATATALAAARDALGEAQVALLDAPYTGSEDFARFLAHVPGCFAFLGNGEESAPLHSPSYDFNDAALPHGVRYFVALVRRRLPEAG